MYQQINAPKSNMKKTLLTASVALNALLVVALCFMAFSGNTLAAPVRSVSVNSQVGRRAAMGLAAARMAKAVNPTSIFETNCGACHQGGGNNIITGHTLSKTAMEQYLDGGWNKESIEYQIRNGKGPMPAWEGVLSDEEIKAMTEWVYEQSTTTFKDVN